MLNRPNEINIIASYTGAYCFNNNEDSRRENNNSRSYIVNDESLTLQIHFKKNQKPRDFQIAKWNNIAALFYGELYNFDELIDRLNWNDGDKRDLSFSHLCCLLYQKYGLYFAKYINGMFSLILRDRKKDLFLIIVDRFGLTKPIYYKISGKLYFSTHLKILLAKQDIDRDIDKESLALFLKYSYIPSPRSIIKDINKLDPGEMIICKKDSCKIERYIDFNIKPTKLSEEEAVYQYTKLLTESISNKLETYGNQKIGIFLSGGLDSSANVALAAKSNKCKFETFGIGFNDPRIDERPYARIAANHFGVPFNDYVFDGSEIEDLPKIIWYLEEPFLENGLFLTYVGYKLAQSKSDVVISGNCADQLFGTGGFATGKPIAMRYLLEKLYLKYFISKAKRITHIPLFYKDNIFFKLKVMLDRGVSFNDWFFWGFDDHELKKLCNFNIQPSFMDVFPDDLSGVPLSLDEYYNHSVIHQDLEHYACQNVLVKSNRISEMFGLITRDSYLDYKVVDFLLSLELPLKRRGSLIDYFQGKTKTKYLHRLSLERMLPLEILSKPKQGGFVDMSVLLSDSNRRDIIYKHILGSNILKEYFDMGYVSDLLKEYEALLHKKIYWQSHRDSKTNKILYLLTFSLWYEIFLKNSEKHNWDAKLSEMLSVL